MINNILFFINKKIHNIESKKITFFNILFSIYLASILRAFFEGYINLLNKGSASSFIDTFFHYPLWFLGVFSSTCIILSLITKEKIEKISKLFIYSPFLVITPIFFDLILNNKGVSYNFITWNFNTVLKSFFSFMTYGDITASIGMRIEMLLSLFIVILYIYLKTHSFKKIMIGLFSVYFVIFMFLSAPTVFMNFNNIITSNSKIEKVGYFFKKNIYNSNLNEKTFIFSFNFGKENLSEQTIENQYSRILSLIFLFVDILLLSWGFWIYSRKKFLLVIKNFRYLRIISYFTVLSFGIFLGNNFISNSFFDIFYIISLFLLVLFIWLFSVWENDEYDVKIDKISNIKRPLPQNKISIKEWSIIKYSFLFIGLNLAFLNGFYSLILSVLFISIYHIYSAPPFRFKKIIGLSSLLISFNILIIVWIGYFSTSKIENLKSFPLKYILFILIFGFLIENIKNIKDIKGDSLNKIKTIPNIIGKRKSKIIFGLILSSFFIYIPFLFYLTTKTLLLSIFFAVIVFFTLNKKKFNEVYIFLIYILYFILFSMFFFLN